MRSRIWPTKLLSLATVAVALLAVPAQAQEKEKPAQLRTGFQLRLDGLNTRTEVTSQPAVESQGFVVKTARFILTGDLSEDLSYTLRLNGKDAFYTGDTKGPDN